MSQQTSGFFEFDSFRVDAARRVLWRTDESVPLPPKVFETLLVLLRNSGRVVSKDELMSAVWPDTIVEENNLTQNVSAIRKALGERRDEHRYVVTVPGRGYSFVAEVRQMSHLNGDSNGNGDGDGNGHRLAATHATVDAEARMATETDAAAETETLRGGRAVRAVSRHGRAQVWAGGLLLLSVALSAAALLVWPQLRGRTGAGRGGAARPIKSIAVLPFRTLGPGPDGEYAGAGMADALITKLSNNRQVAVRPTGAVLRYVGAAFDPLDAGRELGVDALLDGRVQQAGGRVRVTAQLVRVSDGAPVWAGTFDEKLTDVFALQDSISEQLLESLKVTLNREERDLLRRRFTSSVEAAEANAKGHYFMNKGTREGLNKSIEYFEKAVALDPDYALAYAGMGDSYTRLTNHGVAPDRSILKAREVLLKAVAADDTVAYAHSILGRIAFNCAWDFEEAEREYRQARALDPSMVHQWYAFHLLLAGRTAEADAAITGFAQYQPLLLGSYNGYARYLYFKREYDAALEQVSRTLEMDSDFAAAHEMLGMIYEQKGMRAEAVAEFKKAVELSGGRVGLAALGHAYAASGEKVMAEKSLRELAARAERGYVSPYEAALVYAGLGEHDEAVARMEKALAEGSLRPADARFDPRLDALRAEPKFQDFARRHRLPS
jgi:DNA-binding winged helix-turn-helix (wHTH) protein/TolB-like protein/Tfp pilus assembly protein PilF